MNAKSTSIKKAPDQRILTKIQTERLSSLTGIDKAKFAGLSASEIATQFRWQLTPICFCFAAYAVRL